MSGEYVKVKRAYVKSDQDINVISVRKMDQHQNRTGGSDLPKD